MEEQQIEEQVQEQQINTKPQAGSSKYVLQHDRPNCIGCAACEAVAPDFWEMNADGKSDIKGGKNVDNGWQNLELKEKDFVVNKDAADSCPVNVIHIVNKETGERII